MNLEDIISNISNIEEIFNKEKGISDSCVSFQGEYSLFNQILSKLGLEMKLNNSDNKPIQLEGTAVPFEGHYLFRVERVRIGDTCYNVNEYFIRLYLLSDQVGRVRSLICVEIETTEVTDGIYRLKNVFDKHMRSMARELASEGTGYIPPTRADNADSTF